MVGFVWMFTAVIVISFFTASIASSLTLSRLDGPVSGPQDLPGARVGTLEGSAATAYLAADGIGTVTYASVVDGLDAVAERALDAFVHDAPILRHQSRGPFQGRTQVLPGTFLEQYYGIALPRGSPPSRPREPGAPRLRRQRGVGRVETAVSRGGAVAIGERPRVERSGKADLQRGRRSARERRLQLPRLLQLAEQLVDGAASLQDVRDLA